MREDPGARRPLADVYRYSGLGCMFAGAVILFMAGGWVVDRWLGLFPILTIAGALIGAGLGTVSIYHRLIGGDDE